jgi:uncharacterized protein DUF4232
MRLVGSAAVIFATVALTACAAKPEPISQGSNPPPSAAPSAAPSADSAVPWIDQPGSLSLGSPMPGPALPTAGPPCAGSDVRPTYDGGEHGAGVVFHRFSFTNVSATTCALRGTPNVVATEPGKPSVTATPAALFTVVPVALPPGGQSQLEMQTMNECDANHSGAGPATTYHALTIAIPGGGDVAVPVNLDPECGLYVGEFGVQAPDPVYPTPPLAGATFKLELPASVKAGDQLRYVVDIANPTDADMALDPCPSYLEQGPGDPGKTPLQLNCDAVHDVPAGETVRFAIQLPVPADTPTGPAQVCWTVIDITSGKERACGSVEVEGADTPCTSDQVAAAITGPGTAPGPSNMFALKGVATEVALTLTNRSTAPCSVRGTPTVAITGSQGSQLKLTGVDQRSVVQGTNPATPTVVLAHGASATTHLYWYLPWCAPDPNPVTVTITLPANGAAVSAKPVGGWTPPPCKNWPGTAAATGESSADPLQPA